MYQNLKVSGWSTPQSITQVPLIGTFGSVSTIRKLIHQSCMWFLYMFVPSLGLSPLPVTVATPTKNVIILVVTVTGMGDNPRYIFVPSQFFWGSIPQGAPSDLKLSHVFHAVISRFVLANTPWLGETLGCWLSGSRCCCVNTFVVGWRATISAAKSWRRRHLLGPVKIFGAGKDFVKCYEPLFKFKHSLLVSLTSIYKWGIDIYPS